MKGDHTPVERQKLSELAREAIRSRIVSGEFPMGRKLPESELARTLGMSKSPIREALLQLEREGLIVLSTGRTTRVFSMGPTEIRELAELRQMLESEALRLACTRNPATLAQRLSEIVEQMQDVLGRSDTDAYKTLDYEFHDAIFANCGNSFLSAHFHTLSFRIQALRNRLSLDPQLNLRSLGDHADLCAAVAAGKVETALEIMARHISETAHNYIDRVDSDGPDDGTAEPDAHRVAIDEMDRFSRVALAAVGADSDTVDAVTRALTHASTLGVDSHGFRLLPHYLHGMREGRVNARPQVRVVKEHGGACVLDADDGHGARATYEAARIAVERAREHGIGAVAIRGSSHFGAAGAYALEIARKGMMGLAFCNSDAFVRLHGGAERYHGTNPIAAAAPSQIGDPWLLDMATSSIPFNRVLLFRSLGLELPAGVASDGQGNDVTDANAAEMLAPLGGPNYGYKGAGLAGLSEILSSALSDSPLSHELPSMISQDMATPRKLGAFVLALDPDAFGGASVFRAVVGRYVESLRRSGTAAGQAVMAPGDREWKEAESRRIRGMKLDGQTIRYLGEFARKYGLDPLRTMSGGNETEHH